MNHAVRQAMRAVYGRLPAGISLRLQGLVALGYLPRLAAPRTFNEHVHALKLARRDPLLPLLADKVRVKAWVADRIGADFMIPTLWSGRELPARPPCPAPFVVKSNHSSGWNRFVRDLDALDWEALRAETRQWLAADWHPFLHEWWYNEIDRAILIEPLIADDPTDYKFFCFGGRVRAIQVDADRAAAQKRAFYDRAWVRQPFELMYPAPRDELPRPRHLSDMIALAEELARGFAFVRADFYDLESGPLFGELTFAPGAGLERFSPASFDHAFGRMWSEAETAGTPAVPPLPSAQTAERGRSMAPTRLVTGRSRSSRSASSTAR